MQSPMNNSQIPVKSRSRLRWWQAPGDFAYGRRRLLWLALALCASLLVGIVALTSVWNYYGLSLPVPQPASDISEYPPSRPAAIPRPDGAALWVFDAGEPLTAPPAAVDGAVYIVSGQTPERARVAALDDASGAILWDVELGSIADFPPVAAADLLYVGTRAGELICLDRRTGARLWTFDMESSVVGAPIARDGTVYAASNAVYAIDALNGSLRWRHEVEGDVTRGLRLSDGVLAAISSSGDVNFVSAKNGRRRLTFPLWFGTGGAPLSAGGALVVVGDGGFALALDMSARDISMEKALRYWWTKLWLWGMAPSPPLPRGYLWQRRDIEGRTAYPVGADEHSAYIAAKSADGAGSLVALDIESGDVRWLRQLPSGALSPAVVTPDAVIVGSEGGVLFSIDKRNGDISWQYNNGDGGDGLAATLIADGALIVASPQGVVSAAR